MVTQMKTILCFGDSNTYGYTPGTGERFDIHTRWPRKLGQLLGDSYDIVEEGMCNRTTVFSSELDPYCSALDYIIPCLISHSPIDLLIIMLGTNDTKDRYNVSAAEIGMGLETLLSKIFGFYQARAEKIRILLVAPVPLGDVSQAVTFSNTSRDKSLHLSEIYSKLALTYGCSFYDAGSIIHNLGCDGIHLTAIAHSKLAAGLFPIIKRMLE